MFQRAQVALARRPCNFVSLKNVLVLIYSKLHSRSCDSRYKLKKTFTLEVTSSFGESAPPSIFHFSVFGKHLNSDIQVIYCFQSACSINFSYGHEEREECHLKALTWRENLFWGLTVFKASAKSATCEVNKK